MSKKLFIYSIIALFAGNVFVSCNNDTEEPFQVLADAYYVNQFEQGEVRTAISYYAYANKHIASATVSTPSGETVTLEDELGYSTTWLKEPELTDFSTDIPDEGTYQFTVMSQDGVELVKNDVLENVDLGIPEMDTITYNATNFGYNVTWAELENTDAYMIRVLKEDRQIIFSGYTVGDDVLEYDIVQGNNTGTWEESPQSGETYIFQLSAYVFDDDADNSNYAYNLEEISIGEAEVVWGED